MVLDVSGWTSVVGYGVAGVRVDLGLGLSMCLVVVVVAERFQVVGARLRRWVPLLVQICMT